MPLTRSKESFFITLPTPFGVGNHRAAKALYQQLSQTFPTDPETVPLHSPRRMAWTLIGVWGAGMAALLAYFVLHYETPKPLKHLATLADQSVLAAGDTHLLHLSADDCQNTNNTMLRRDGNMANLTILVLLLLHFFLLGIIFYRMFVPPKGLLKKITVRHPELVSGATPYHVGYFSRYDLIQPSKTRASASSTAVLSSRQRSGYLFVNHANATFIALGPDAQWLVQTFTPADTHIALFDHAGISIGLPSYIRISTSDESLYVTPKIPSGWSRHKAAKLLFQTLSRHFPTRPLPAQPESLHRQLGVTLGVWSTVFAVLIAVWSRYYGRPLDPLKYLATMPDNSVLVAGDTHLLRLSPDGATRLEERAMADLGFMDGPMALQVEPQGTILIGDRQEKTIKRCDPTTWRCQTLAGLDLATPLFQDAFTFAVDPDTPRLLANDMEGNRILELDLDGRLIRTVLAGNTICSPQNINVRQGHLIVVKTQHHNHCTGQKNNLLKNMV